MIREEILEYQAKQAAFIATDIGKTFIKFKNAHARAWRCDTEDSFTDQDRKSTKDAWEACKQAEEELRILLYKVVGMT